MLVLLVNMCVSDQDSTYKCWTFALHESSVMAAPPVIDPAVLDPSLRFLTVANAQAASSPFDSSARTPSVLPGASGDDDGDDDDDGLPFHILSQLPPGRTDSVRALLNVGRAIKRRKHLSEQTTAELEEYCSVSAILFLSLPNSLSPCRQLLLTKDSLSRSVSLSRSGTCSKSNRRRLPGVSNRSSKYVSLSFCASHLY